MPWLRKQWVTKTRQVYTQSTSKCRIQLGLETPLGEALVEDNSSSIVKIHNDG